MTSRVRVKRTKFTRSFNSEISIGNTPTPAAGMVLSAVNWLSYPPLSAAILPHLRPPEPREGLQGKACTRRRHTADKL